jgi:hypothetical protein
MDQLEKATPYPYLMTAETVNKQQELAVRRLDDIHLVRFVGEMTFDQL